MGSRGRKGKEDEFASLNFIISLIPDRPRPFGDPSNNRGEQGKRSHRRHRMIAAAVSIHGASPPVVVGMKAQRGSREDGIGNNLTGMRRSVLEPQLRCSLSIPRPAAAAAAPAKVQTSRSIGLFPFIPNSIRSFLFDSEEEANGGMRPVDPKESSEEEVESETEKQANWVERIWELRIRWRDRKPKEDKKVAGNGGEEMDELCAVSYDSGEEEGKEVPSDWDEESFE